MSRSFEALEPIVAAGLSGFLIGACIVGGCADASLREVRVKAVKVGAAEWVVDEYGKATFTWKVDKK